MRFSPWRLLLALFDAGITALAAFVAVTLFHNGAIPPQTWEALQLTLPVTMALVIGCNYLLGLYNRVWRYAGIETGIAVGISTTLALLSAALIGKYMATPLPIVVWYTTWLFSLFAISTSRFSWRLIRPGLQRVLPGGAHSGNGSGHGTRRILVYGAGLRGCSLSRKIDLDSNPSYRIVGFVDDDPQKRSAFVGGYRVLGRGEDLPDLVVRHRADEVVITIAELSKSDLQRILLHCREAKVKTTIMPSLVETLGGQRLQPREINIEDLLGRDIPVTGIDLHEDYLEGRTVLVTGAGGSIGSELSRQICRYNPAQLILLGRGENRIHWVYRELKERHPRLKIIPVIHNITDASAMERIFEQYRPDVVFHAAAHKHVYLMECVPTEAARNNVLGTQVVADLAEKYGVGRFVFISTDKAVAPTSVMGATKRACELMLMNRRTGRTKYICVRFGNVLGSEGSVLAIFHRQWKAGQPLTVTDPQATRYFMSIPEASFLVLQAGAIGDHGDVFLFDMGKPVQIGKLAEEFILLHGGNPHDPAAIRVTGLCEGEKLHEVLVHQNEELVPTGDPYVMKIANANGQGVRTVDFHLNALRGAVTAEDDDEVLRILNELTGGRVQPERTSAASQAM